MKSLKFLLLPCLVAAGSIAVGAETRAVPNEVSAAAWLESYYLNPQPAELPLAIQRLSREGYFDRPANTAIAIGFLGTLFAHHPERVDGWLLQLNGLPLKHNRILAAALWQSGHPLGGELLRVLGQSSPLRAEIERVAGTPSQPIIDTPVRSASSMNLQWGAFLATGDERHIVAVLEAMGGNEPGLTAVARVALAQNAVAHPRVLEICRVQLERQPEEVQGVLRAALRDAAVTAPRS